MAQTLNKELKFQFPMHLKEEKYDVILNINILRNELFSILIDLNLEHFKLNQFLIPCYYANTV